MTPPTIDREFAEKFLMTIDDPGAHGVHLLFNEFWTNAPESVVSAYATQFETDDELATWVEADHYAEPLTVERLGASPPGSLGEAAHTFIVANGLEQNLATNYRAFHEVLRSTGVLDGMPERLQYAILRGFQIHDYQHVMAGFGPSPGDEIALQAFCLAQLRFPYFAMWMAVVTARMAFIDPTSTVGLMDHITDGWRFGRGCRSLQFERWEERIDEPLVDLRREFAIAPEGRSALERSALPAP